MGRIPKKEKVKRENTNKTYSVLDLKLEEMTDGDRRFLIDTLTHQLNNITVELGDKEQFKKKMEIAKKLKEAKEYNRNIIISKTMK